MSIYNPTQATKVHNVAQIDTQDTASHTEPVKTWTDISKICAVVSIAAGIFYALFSIINLTINIPALNTALAISPTDRNITGTAIFTIIWVALFVGLIAHITSRRLTLKDGSANTLGPLESNPAPNSSRGASHSHSVKIAILGLILVLLVYHGIFYPGVITWGDWSTFINISAIKGWFPYPTVWSFSNLGFSNAVGSSFFPLEVVMGLGAHLGAPWWLIERIFFYIPAVVLCYLGPFLLLRFLNYSPWYCLIAGILFTVNPYALVLISGGQLTVGVGYALLPFFAILAIAYLRRPSIPRALGCGMVLGVQAWFDPREATLSIGVSIVVIAVLLLWKKRAILLPLLKPQTLIIPLSAFILQLQWILPTLIGAPPKLPASFAGSSSLSSLSFITLGDALGLFHPFWPKYIFPHVFVMPAIWITIPVIVGLLLLVPIWNKTIIPVALTIYLAFSVVLVGANLPFGSLNTWIFTHIPEMSAFRDPSVFFGPIALALAILIPTAIFSKQPSSELSQHKSVDWLGSANTKLILGIFFIILLVTSAFPALSGTLKHDLAPRTVPASYTALENFVEQHNGSILWIPAISRFANKQTLEHPSIGADKIPVNTKGNGTVNPGLIFVSPSLSWLLNTPRQSLNKYHIAYVVVRLDATSYGSAYPYPETLEQTLAVLKHFKHYQLGSRLRLYEVNAGANSPFTLDGPHKSAKNLKWASSTTDSYTVTVNNDTTNSSSNSLLVFWQHYNPQWTAVAGGVTLQHISVNGWANGFVLPTNTAKKVDITYSPQKGLDIGLDIEAIFLLLGLAIIIISGIISLSKTINSRRGI